MREYIWCFYLQEEGGTTKATEEIISTLKKRKKYRVKELCIKNSSTKSFRLVYSLFSLLFIYAEILVWIQKQNNHFPSVIYTPSSMIAFVSLFFPLMPKVKIVKHFHNFDFGDDTMSLPRYIKKISKRKNILVRLYLLIFMSIYYKVDNYCFKHSWKIICPSEYSKKIILYRYPKINPKRIYIVPNGVNHALFFPKRVHPTINKLKLLYVGRFVPEKGIHILLQSVAKLSLPHTLTLVCPSFNNQMLKTMLIKILNGSEIINFIQNPSQKHLSNIYRNHDVSILPTMTSFEQMPLVYLESIACGTPVVTSLQLCGINNLQKIVSPKMIFQQGSSTELAKTISWYYQLSESEKNRMSKKYIKVSLNFSWEHTARTIEEILTCN